MAKEQTALESWKAFLKGIFLSLGCYLLGMAVLALLLVKGSLPENSAFGVITVWCGVSASIGSVFVKHRVFLKPIFSTMLFAVLFIGILFAIGSICWQEGIAWTGKGSILAGSALTGSILSVFVTGRKKSRKRKKGNRDISQKLKKLR